MALLFCDGFDHYDDAYIDNKWDYNSGYIYPTSGRRGKGCLRLWWLVQTKKLIDNKQTLIIGAAVKQETNLNYLSNTEANLFSFMDGTTYQIKVRTGSSVQSGQSTIEVFRGSTSLGSSTDRVLKSYIYQYIEAKVVIHSTAGSVVVKVDGETVINLTNINTQESANAYVNEIVLGPLGNNSQFIDDLYICDDSGSYNNDFLGDIKITAHFPTSDGTHSDFTPSTGTDHYALVDEVNLAETDFNDGDALNEIDSYGVTVGSDLGTIHGVQLVGALQNTDVGTKKCKQLIRSNSVDYLGTKELTLSYDLQILPEVWERDPADSAAWTATKLNAAEIGVKVTL